MEKKFMASLVISTSLLAQNLAYAGKESRNAGLRDRGPQVQSGDLGAEETLSSTEMKTNRANEGDETSSLDKGLLISANLPLVTAISPDVQPAIDWDYVAPKSGREYWLHSSRGRYMTFHPNKFYTPYNDQNNTCAGLTQDPNSNCSIKPSAVTQECQRIAGSTLKAIMANPPAELKALQSHPVYGGNLIMFGWVQDGYSDREHATPTGQSLFLWRSGKANVSSSACPADFKKISAQVTYLKWVSALSPEGECRSPSLGQLMAILQKTKTCLEKNNNIVP